MTDTDYELDYNVPEPPDTSIPFWKPKEHSGALSIFEVSHVAQDRKYRSEEMTDYVYGVVHILDGADAGNRYRLQVSNVKIVQQLKSKSGKRVVGRVQKESDDANAAWIVDTKSVTEDDRQLAEKYMKGEPVADKAPPF